MEYESVLVAFEDGQLLGRGGSHRGQARRPAPARHPRAGHDHRAGQLAHRRRPARAGGRAQATIDSARVRGGRRVTGHWEKVRAGEAGRRIVEEAREIHAAAIVMPLPPRRTGIVVFGRTLETVLAERPCRVIIDSSRGEQNVDSAA